MYRWQKRYNSILKLGIDLDITKLLYSQEGIEETVKIWKEFEKARKEIKESRGEEAENEERERGWGWGWGGLDR